jgi:hypothetical protein
MMTMGGEHEMDTGSFAGTDGSSRSGQQYPDMSSNIDGVHLDAQESLESVAEEDVVYVDAHGDETSAPCPSCTPESSIQAHLANSTYARLCEMIKGLKITLDQDLPQVCTSGSYAP